MTPEEIKQDIAKLREIKSKYQIEMIESKDCELITKYLSQSIGLMGKMGNK